MRNSSLSFCCSSRAFCTPVIAPQAGSCVTRSRMQSCHGLLVRESQHPGTICPNRCKFEFAASPAFSFTTCLCTHTGTPPCSLPAVYCLFVVAGAVSSSRQRGGGTTALLVTGLGLAGSHKAPEAGSCISSVPLGQPGRALTASSQQHLSGFVIPWQRVILKIPARGCKPRVSERAALQMSSVTGEGRMTHLITKHEGTVSAASSARG